MSGTIPPGSPPPEVPEEFAAAYMAAYEQALAAQTGGGQHRDDSAGEEPEDLDEGSADTDELERLAVRRGPIRIGTHRSAERGQLPAADRGVRGDDSPTVFERIRDSGWFVPFLLAVLAFLLVFGAYAVGRRFTGQVAGDPKPSSGSVTGGGGTDNGRQSITHQKPGKGAWTGKIQPVGNVRADAGCTMKPGVEASGKKVAYDAGNLTDHLTDTAWRCDGSAIGVRITLQLGKDLPIGEVGLIPGYAKTDEQSGADRYAENNRITRVRWRIGGTDLVQKLSGSPEDRSLQLIRVPSTTTSSVALEILGVKRGSRGTTAISEIQLGRSG